MKGEELMKQTAIKLFNVVKSYGRQSAVKGLDLQIEKGELFGFLGPNGAGKTTTIKMMTGLLEPTSGSVEINGINIWDEPIEAKRQISYVPDHPNLYPKLTGRDYLEFVASVYQVSKQDYEERATELLNIFSLTDRADELIESYSHGMKQKVAICGALIHEPKILFLDEPTVGLDPKSARYLKNLLRQKCNEGMTVFITTHILEIAEQMCDRIGIISDGEVIALGTMDELRQLDGRTDGSLEDIFLELTGGEEQQDLIKEISGEQV